MSPLRTAALLLACCALACGRVGFELLPDDAGDPFAGDAGEASDPGPGDGDGWGFDYGDGGTGFQRGDCRVPGVIVCADFDQGMPRGASTELEGSGSISVQSGVLVAKTRAGRSRAALRFPLGQIDDGDVHVRLRARFPSGFDLDQINFATLSSGVGSGQDVDFNLLAPDRFEVYFAPEDSSAEAPFEAPRDRFMCVLLHVSIGDYRGSASVTVDGQSVLDARRRDTHPTAGVRELRVGIDYTSRAQDTAEVHIDDVVVATQPLSGC